jgi:Glycosyltransferase family 87
MGLDWLRTANWLDAARLRGYLWLLALLNLAALAWLIATSHGGIDRNGYLLGTDFLSFWAVGEVLLAGGNAYDTAAHIAAQRDLYAGHSGYTAFFYPPPFLLACAPLGLLGYFPALGLWLAGTGAAFVAALRPWLRGLSGRQLALVLAAFPAVLLTITHGQTSFLAAALLGGGVWLAVSGGKGWAGVLLGLAVIKPQFGLLVPLALLAAGEWRVIASATATALGFAAAATLAFGVEVWPAWYAASGSAQAAMAGGAVGFAKMTSLFAAARLAGAGTGLAYGLQLALSLACAALIVHLFRRRGLTRESGAALLAGALLTTPFVLDYDLLLLAFPLAVLADRPRPWEKAAALAGFVLPALARPLAMTAGIGIAPLVLAAVFALLLRRAHRPETDGGRSKD